jgi:hypothetical protein
MAPRKAAQSFETKSKRRIKASDMRRRWVTEMATM